jgi:hypothetical protein
MNRSGRLLVVLSALVLTGCPKPDTRYTQNTTGATQADAKVDPWDAVAKRLRKETDPAGVRAAFNKLAEDLAARPDVPGPPGLSPDAEKALVPLARLAPEDLDVVRPAVFAGADPAYVAECFYLRDAAHSIDPVRLPPAEQARAAFAWVCRQVYVRPWVTDDGRFVPAVPPTYVLRRGWGTGYERATVALALFQQLGLDAGLVGPPDAADRQVGFVPPWADQKAERSGPFWAVAVRAGADVLLFDPVAGRPFPGPLARVKANPDLLKAWADDKDHPWAVPADQVKQATVYLSVPLPALAPRMATLEEKTKAEVGAVLAVDLRALRDRFAAPAPAGPGLGDVRVWNPPNDGLAYPRVLANFLPADEGGTDRRPPGQRLLDLYMASRFPRQMFAGADVLPRGLEAQAAKDRLVLSAAAGYEAAFLANPTPRERMQRGQLQDATRFLSDRQDAFARGQEQVRNASPEQVDLWVKTANELYAALRRAEFPDPNQLRPNPPTDPAVAAARAQVEEFWRVTGPVAQAIIARATARTGLAEASYLLALTKHEEAERQQLRAEKVGGPDAARAKATAANAWAEAANTWRSYLDQSANLPGLEARTAHARGLSARAEALAGKKD